MSFSVQSVKANSLRGACVSCIFFSGPIKAVTVHLASGPLPGSGWYTVAMSWNSFHVSQNKNFRTRRGKPKNCRITKRSHIKRADLLIFETGCQQKVRIQRIKERIKSRPEQERNPVVAEEEKFLTCFREGKHGLWHPWSQERVKWSFWGEPGKKPLDFGIKNYGPPEAVLADQSQTSRGWEGKGQSWEVAIQLDG